MSLANRQSEIICLITSNYGFLPRLDFPTEDIFINKQIPRVCSLSYRGGVILIDLNYVYDFVRFFKSEFFYQTWTDVSKNSSKTAKNTEKWFSRNISGETCTQVICVWA
jgi:hypothetical protein